MFDAFDSVLEPVRDELEDAAAVLLLYYFGRRLLAVLSESCKNDAENRPGQLHEAGDLHPGEGKNEG